MRNARGNAAVLLLAVLLAFGGGLLASLVQTDFGNVDVGQVRFAAADGRIVNARLYRPVAATADAPAPAVLAVHGYINSEGTQAPYAIELARRGYVVVGPSPVASAASTAWRTFARSPSSTSIRWCSRATPWVAGPR